MPSNWDFQTVFLCVTNRCNKRKHKYFFESYYLNCHFYPHNTVGEGYVTMAITDSVTTEQVTWHGIAGSVGIVNNWYDTKQKKHQTIYDLNGKNDRFISNNIYIVIFEDNTLEKFLLTNNKRAISLFLKSYQISFFICVILIGSSFVLVGLFPHNIMIYYFI